MRIDEIRTIAQSKFVGFTMERLDKRHDILMAIITDKNAPASEIKEAAVDLEQVELCIKLFIQEDVDDLTATPADILEIVTGQSIEKLQKHSAGGVLAQDIVEKTSSAMKTTGTATKKGLHGFANWLANKTKVEA